MRLPPLTASRAPRGLRHAVALALLAGSGAPLWSSGAAAQDAISADAEFTVADLKVEGLQRIAEGTVFNDLPVAIGDRLTRAKTEEALRALYATGFFRNVELRREGDALVVVGSSTSSNSNRLRELGERAQVPSYQVDDAQNLKREWFEAARVVGVTAGASAPELLVRQVVAQLQAWGGEVAEELAGRPEQVVFSLPRALRKTAPSA